jgi:DNA-binding transcriptional MerR regulator
MKREMSNQKMMRAYSINEVSEQLNVPTGTIRQWEKDLQGLLIIPRTKQGARFYTDYEIALLDKIKEMRSQNLHKGMIRSLLEKYLNPTSEAASESFETNVPAVTPFSTQEPGGVEEKPLEEMGLSIEAFKQELLSEIKKEINSSKKEMIDEIKNELFTQSLHTVQEVSKSIQRSNDKRKGEVQFLTDTIHQVSEQTSEGFETLSNEIAKSSQGTSERFEALTTSLVKASEGSFEKLSKQLKESSKMTSTVNKHSFEHVTRTVEDVKNSLTVMAKSMEKEQTQLLKTMEEFKESQVKIQEREEMFQQMVSGLREVAAARNEKKQWWKFWKN